MTTKKKIVLVISLYLILITLVYIDYVNSLLDQIDRTDQAFISSEIGISEKVEKNLGKFTGEVINIALFGIDTETGDRGRSEKYKSPIQNPLRYQAWSKAVLMFLQGIRPLPFHGFDAWRVVIMSEQQGNGSLWKSFSQCLCPDRSFRILLWSTIFCY